MYWFFKFLPLFLTASLAQQIIFETDALAYQSEENAFIDFGEQVLLKPKNPNGKNLLVVFVQGAQIPPRDYKDLVQRIQEKMLPEFSAWIGFPGLLADLALGDIFSSIHKLRRNAHTAGLPLDTPLVFVSHSLGALAIQKLLAEYSEELGNIQASVYLGGGLLRQYNTTSFKQPWMSMSGELDGLHLPGRQAQSFYQYTLDKKEKFKQLALHVPGMNHMQYSTGPAPFLPQLRDLKSEISGDEARDRVSSMIANFFLFHLTSSKLTRAKASQFLVNSYNESKEFFMPLLTAMHLEANYYLKKPCNSDNPSTHCPFYPAWPPQPKEREPSSDTDCFCSIPWSKLVVEKMSQLPLVDRNSSSNIEIVVQDAIHDVRDTHPFHHAHIWNNCSLAYEKGNHCVLNVTTVSELSFDPFTNLDTGASHASAREIRVKMKSRQLYKRSSIDPMATFEEDYNNVCMEMNQYALQWALDNTPPKIKTRYFKHGEKLHFLPDHHYKIPIGPLWIYTPLKMYHQYFGQERKFVIQSISMRTTIDGWMNRLHPDSGGQHYCKVLSPARALEWVYIDSLRMNWSLGRASD